MYQDITENTAIGGHAGDGVTTGQPIAVFGVPAVITERDYPNRPKR